MTDMPRSRFLRALAERLTSRVLQPTWLIAPTTRVGVQWLDRLAWSGVAVSGVRVRALRHLAADTAFATADPNSPCEWLTGWRRILPVERAFARLVQSGPAYFRDVRASRVWIETLDRSIRDLRLAGVRSTDLREEHFESGAKGRDLIALLAAYEEELAAASAWDTASLLEHATAAAAHAPHLADPDLLILRPADLQLTALEERFWNALPAEKTAVLPVDAPDAEARKVADARTDLGRLAWLGDPGAAPSPVNDGSLRLTSAVGAANEVRAVFRQLRAESIPLDEVELLYTDGTTYAPLVYEIAAGLGDPEAGRRVSLEEGLPCSYTRPGRALAGWVAWQREGYSQQALLRLLEEGLLKVVGGDDGDDGHVELAALLRRLPVGQGRERMREVLLRAERAARLRADEQTDDADAMVWSRRRDALIRLRESLFALLDATPAGADASPAEWLGAARVFLEIHARPVDEADNYASGKLLEEIAGLADIHGRFEGALDCLAVRDWLATLPEETHILGEGPRPGRLYAAPLHVGGHSGRGHTVVLGLDDARLPGRGGQDPILLDAERRRIASAVSTEIPTTETRLQQRLSSARRVLARAEGRLTLSYTCRDLDGDAERVPSGLFLDAFRILAGSSAATLEEYLAARAVPASFAPAHADEALGHGECWLSCLTGAEPAAEPRTLIESVHAHLARGRLAVEARRRVEFTEYDGHVPAAGRDLDPTREGARRLSAGALECYARSPMEYFFRYGLRIAAVEDWTLDPDRWLDSAARGTLLHTVFQRAVGVWMSENREPHAERDLAAVQAIAEEELARAAEQIPPPAEHIYRAEAEEILRAAQLFLRMEAAGAGQADPYCLEAEIGLRQSVASSSLGVEEAVLVRLPSGTRIPVCGKVDRVDRCRDDETAFIIIDYKTGLSSYYNEQAPFDKGRRIQNALYVPMVRTRLRATGVEDAKIRSFHYVFPTDRGGGVRIGWSTERLTEGLVVVEALCRGIAAGAFPLSDVKDDLSRAGEFLRAMGGAELLLGEIRAKWADEQNLALEPLREAREHA